MADAKEGKTPPSKEGVTPAGEEKAAKKQYEATGPKKPRQKKAKAEGPPKGQLTRRKFAWRVLGLFMLGLTVGVLRFFFPRTLTEPPTKVRIGYPGDFNYGVDTRFQSKQRIWVVRGAEGLFVILAKCTHLGCTPNWVEQETKFKCPCHGSGFDSEGVNFEGPAPRPLDRCRLELDPQGRIVVDKLRTYKQTQWEATREQWLLRV